MQNILLAQASLIIFCLAMLGWGNTLRTLLKLEDSLIQIPQRIVLGIATVVVIGGILNMLGIAYSASLNSVVGVGLLLFISTLVRFARTPQTTAALIRNRLGNISPASLLLGGAAIACFLFFSTALIPSNAFNLHDDMHTYLVRPLLMLETGTLGGNPLSLLGLDSLGGQAFLQAFAVNHFGITYINAFDAVLCLGLALWLALSHAKITGAGHFVAASALITLIFISPQQVNTSSVYSSVLFALALTLSTQMFLVHQEKASSYRRLTLLLPSLLFLVTLVTLKALTAIYASLYMALTALVWLSTSHDKKRALQTVLSAILVTLLLASPWFLTHAEKYQHAISGEAAAARMLSDENSANSSSKLDEIRENIREFPLAQILSPKELYWGGSLLAYNLLFLIVLASFVTLTTRLLTKSLPLHHAALAAACGATSITYLFGILMFEYFEMALRYALPLLIANVCALCLSIKPGFGQKWRLPALAGLSGFIVLLFSNSLGFRLESAADKHQILSFNTPPVYDKYMHASLAETAYSSSRALQNLTEEKSGILLWSAAPFRFDLTRNNITTIADPSFMMPWFDIPSTSGPEAMAAALQRHGIDYVIWDYSGFGIKPLRSYTNNLENAPLVFRKLATEVIAFRKTLLALAKTSTILYQKNGIVVFKVPENKAS